MWCIHGCVEQQVDVSIYGMVETDEQKYFVIFQTVDTDHDNLISRDDGMELFNKSGLSQEVCKSKTFLHDSVSELIV
jgi:hypothetical protein